MLGSSTWFMLVKKDWSSGENNPGVNTQLRSASQHCKPNAPGPKGQMPCLFRTILCIISLIMRIMYPQGAEEGKNTRPGDAIGNTVAVLPSRTACCWPAFKLWSEVKPVLMSSGDTSFIFFSQFTPIVVLTAVTEEAPLGSPRWWPLPTDPGGFPWPAPLDLGKLTTP